jgi:hypothetical protein
MVGGGGGARGVVAGSNEMDGFSFLNSWML